MKMTIDEFKLFAPRIASEDETRRALRRPFRFQRRAYVTDGRVALVLDEACDASLVTAVEAGATTAALQLDKHITAFAAANVLGCCEMFGLDAALLRAAARATFADLEPSMDYLRSHEADPDDPGDVSTTESVRFVHERYSRVILPDCGRTVVAGHFADILADVLAATGARHACVRHDIRSVPVYAGGENWHLMIMPLRAELTFGETGWMVAASVADAATGELLHSYYPDDDEEGRVDLCKLRFPGKGGANG